MEEASIGHFTKYIARTPSSFPSSMNLSSKKIDPQQHFAKGTLEYTTYFIIET